MQVLRNKVRLLMSMLLLASMSVSAQIHGVVKEQGSNEPLGFANVAYLSHSDSTLISGTITDSTGYFSFNNLGAGGLLKVSFIGYKTLITNVTTGGNLGTISLERDTHLLEGAVVTGKMYVRTTDGITVNIGNGPLSKLGDATDVLKHLPFVFEKDGAITVLGKGTPLIYINDRPLRDLNELKQINSSDIRKVEVITNPGSEYSVAVNSIIKITTSRPLGEGWGGTFNAGISYDPQLSPFGGADINYRKGDFDFFSSLYYDRSLGRSNQSGTRNISSNRLTNVTQFHTRSTSWSGKLGFDYVHHDALSFGMFYRHNNVGNQKIITLNGYNYYKGDTLSNTIASSSIRKPTAQSHYINAYVNYNFTKDTYFRFNADWLNSKSTEDQDYLQDPDELLTANKSKNKLIAGQLKFVTPFIGGKITIGMDGSYTQAKNDFRVLDNTTLQNSLQSSNNTSDQNLVAGFAEYRLQLTKRWEARLGGRFEHTGFDYYEDGVKDNEVSQTYNGFYPSAALAYNGDVIQLSLAYRNVTLRPSYFSLRSSVQFDSPYSFESGNPTLQSLRSNRLTFSLGWKDLQLMTNYFLNTNPTVFVSNLYEGSDSIDIFHPINIKKNQTLDIALVYNPTFFKIWTPTLTVDMTKQFLTYNHVKFNKPIFTFLVNNMLNLPHHFIVGVDMNITTSGNVTNDLQYYYANAEVDAYCIKSFLHEKLSLKLEVSNVFNSTIDKWRRDVNGVAYDNYSNTGKRFLLFTIRYSFNPSNKKYKGESSTDELSRLKP